MKENQTVHHFIRYPNLYMTPGCGHSIEECAEMGKIHAANGWVRAQPGNYSNKQLVAYIEAYELELLKNSKP